MKTLTIALLALILITVACTSPRSNIQPISPVDEIQNTNVDTTQDMTANLVVETMDDPGMLDDTQISEEIPE